MDDYIYYAIFLLIYLVYSALAGGKKKKKKPLPTSTGQPLPGPTGDPVEPGMIESQPTMDDALREIRIALGMEPPPAPSPPTPTPPPVQPAPRPAPHPTRSHGPSLAETAPQKSWPSEFKAIPTHFADSDFEELRTRDGDRFGQRPQRPKPTPAKPSQTSKRPPSEPSPYQQPTSAEDRRSRIRQQLNNPDAAREAFILSEIFGPPHANRRR